MTTASLELLSSEIWINYTQQRYLTPDEMKVRLKVKSPKEWDATAKQLMSLRRAGSIPLLIPSMKPQFWFYPSDVINRKVAEVERIGSALSERIHRQSNFYRDFILDSVIEEAITSAIYEGAHSTRAKAQKLIASGEKPKNKDEWMLYNNVIAMKWMREHVEEPLSKKTILSIHKTVTANTLPVADAGFSGKFRDDEVFVGPHRGPDHQIVEEALSEMLKVVSENRRYIPLLIRGILIHYFVAYIHPFFDGNGRTARALFYLKTMQDQIAYVELLSVSAYLKEHGRQYEKAFVKVVENGFDVTYFIDFCLDSMLSALNQVSRKVDYLLSISNLRESHDLSLHQIGLLQRMALHKFRAVSIDEYAVQIGKSREHARKDLRMLNELGLVRDEKVGKKFVYRVDVDVLKRMIAE